LHQAPKTCPPHDHHERGIDRQRLIPGIEKPGFLNRLLAYQAIVNKSHASEAITKQVLAKLAIPNRRDANFRIGPASYGQTPQIFRLALPHNATQ
jgi:hypothetical protein